MDLMLLSSEATKLLKELQYLKQRFKSVTAVHLKRGFACVTEPFWLWDTCITATPGLFYCSRINAWIKCKRECEHNRQLHEKKDITWQSRNEETDTRGTEQQNDGRLAKLPKQQSNKRVMGTRLHPQNTHLLWEFPSQNTLAGHLRAAQKEFFILETGREKDFRTKWSVFSSLLNMVWNSVYLTDCAPI